MLTIITRTSNRPKYFEQNRKSILEQTYPNITHLVGVDDVNSVTYVREHGVEPIILNREKLINQYGQGTAVHNLYFNELMQHVKTPLVMILDDDDCLSNSASIEKVMNYQFNERTLVVFQMEFINNTILPPKEILTQKPQQGLIGSPCVIAPTYLAKNIIWDANAAGDYRYIEQLYEKASMRLFIPETIVKVGQIGGGNKKDL
ncbi:MAG: glycosyltransferase family A protein [Bacteroidales bacterium]|nr:glycosyltransferase family A protein [Bacteroidales bacterium]